MKTVLLSLLSAAVLFSGGCVFMAPEDRDFYGKGWVKPSELDAPMPHHTIPDPSHPQQVAAAPVPAAAGNTDPQWLVPEPAVQ